MALKWPCPSQNKSWFRGIRPPHHPSSIWDFDPAAPEPHGVALTKEGWKWSPWRSRKWTKLKIGFYCPSRAYLQSARHSFAVSKTVWGLIQGPGDDKWPGRRSETRHNFRDMFNQNVWRKHLVYEIHLIHLPSIAGYNPIFQLQSLCLTILPTHPISHSIPTIIWKNLLLNVHLVFS